MRMNIHADPTAEKREAYDAASVLLAKRDDCSLRYAALELRRCMEAIVYEKLKVYDVLLPEGSVHQWQPSQAFDALIAVEPNAQETCTLSIAIEQEPGAPAAGPYRTIGTDERPKGKWIKKTWNKLGYYLHAEWPFSANKPRVSPQPFLEKTPTELAPFVTNSFTSTIIIKIEFTCSGCGGTVKVMDKAVESNREATCFGCGMRYRAEKSEGSFTFFPNEPEFTCSCGAVFFIPSRHLKIGYKFACRVCKHAFQLTDFEWKFNAVANDSGASKSESEDDSEEQ